MKSLLYSLLVFCVVTSTWLQAASGRHVSNKLNVARRYFANDEYFRGEPDLNDNQPEINEKDLPKNGELFEGDMVMDNTIRRAVLGLNSKRSAVVSAKQGEKMHWPGGVVPYALDPSLKDGIRVKIPEAIENFNKFTCVKFVPKKDSDVDYVVFKDGKGCSSSVGRQGGRQFIHLALGCKRIGTVMHEMMHSLGIIHEQSRPDRDKHVNVRFDHIKPKLLPNFRKYSLDEADNMDIPYNFFSVMHYSNYAFSKDQEETLVAKSDDTLKFGQRVELTPLDVLQINKLYPCRKKISKDTAKDLVPNMTEQDVAERRDERERQERQEEEEEYYY